MSRKHLSPEPQASIGALAIQNDGDVPADLVTTEERVVAEMDRRDFLRVGGTLAAAAAISTAACQPPTETSVPFNERPEGLRTHGKPKHYATVVDGSPVLVRTREGRPILVTNNPDDASHRGLSLRSHAALLDLYDPDRAPGPYSVRRGKGQPVAADWQTIGTEVVGRLKKGGVALLTGPVTGPATRALIGLLEEGLGVRHVGWTPIANDAAASAWKNAFGSTPMPRPRLDSADLIVGFGAEFLEQQGLGFERDFAKRRDPNADLSRFIQIEGRLSLTGANADQRIRARDSQLGHIAAAVAHSLIVKMKLGPLAGKDEVAAALTGFVTAPGVKTETVEMLAKALAAAGTRALAMAGGAASGAASGVLLETAVALINLSLNGYDAPVFDRSLSMSPTTSNLQGLAELAVDMRAKKITTLIIAGANPIYDAPAELNFADALGHVELIVSLNDRIDETSAYADYLAPVSHVFESWGDADLGSGLFAVQQPVLRPLYDTHGLLDVLVAWGSAAGVTSNIAAAKSLVKNETTLGYHYLRRFWQTNLMRDGIAWEALLRVGEVVLQKPEPIEIFPPEPNIPFELDLSALAALNDVLEYESAVELQLYAHSALLAGAAANNGWLQELPDPITRITWGNAVSIAPRRFDDLGLRNGDLVDVTVGETTLTLPAYRHAGMAHAQIAIPFGFGRIRAGEVGNNIGTNVFGLQSIAKGRAIHSGLAASIKKNGGHEELAIGQGADVVDRVRRPIVPLTTASEFKSNPKAGTEQFSGGASAWPKHEYKNQRWGMAIDLSRCIGCGQCSIACQAENNIPVVGKKGIIDGREMWWMRVDRYYDAPKKAGGWGDDVYDAPLEVVEEPVTVFEPMLCQHCENAPCETVCPFNATIHSEDGLNQQIYNRCVGTRYCANNCPFKVRRYNWFEYSKPKTHRFFTMLFPELKRHAVLNTRGQMQLKNNPEVTVRIRGVMEKCSFCVQRIRECRAEAIRQGKDKNALPDGTVITACMAACPTEAIVFGDLNDTSSRVSALSKTPRAMRLLDSVGVQPSISYLTKVRNDKV